MATLYDLTEDMKALQDLELECIDEETGEITDSEALTKFEEEIYKLLQEKSTGIINYYNSREYFLENIKAEIKRLQALKKSIETKQDNFKQYIKYCMKNMDVKKIETSAGNISLRKSEKTEINDENIIPAKFTTIVQEIKISKADIKKAIKNGEDVPGAALVQDFSVTIK